MTSSIERRVARMAGVLVLGLPSLTGCAGPRTSTAAAELAQPDGVSLDPYACEALESEHRVAEPLPTHSKDAVARAETLTRGAIELMDGGEVDAATEKLAEAAAVAPGHPVVVYETAYLHFLTERYAKVVELLRPDTLRYGPMAYQMLGNAYDHLGRPDCALRAYGEGIEAFGDYGGFYLEVGVAHARRGDPARAFESWETGMWRAPHHSSLYLKSAILMAAHMPLWAAFYLETFLNLEPEGPRAEAASRDLLQIYRDAISTGADEAGQQTLSVNLVPSSEMTMPNEGEQVEVPFPLRWELSFAAGMAQAVPENASESMSVVTLHRARRSVIEQFRERWPEESRTHPLLAWHGRLLEAGVFEAYDHILFRHGDPEEWQRYVADHKAELEAFVQWTEENHIGLGGSYATLISTSPSSRPHESEAWRAIHALELDPTVASKRQPCATILAYAVESSAVEVKLTREVIPWLEGGPAADVGEEAGAALGCAFLAGNVRAQLAAGTAGDRADAGMAMSLRVYAALSAAGAMTRSAHLDSLLERSRE